MWTLIGRKMDPYIQDSQQKILQQEVRLQQKTLEDYRRLEQESLRAVGMCKLLMVICMIAVMLYWVVLIVWAYWLFVNQDQFVREILGLKTETSADALFLPMG